MGRERDGERAANERKRTGERRMTGSLRGREREREKERDAHRLPLAISDFYRTPRLNVDAEMVELKTAHTDTQAVREREKKREGGRERKKEREAEK